MLRRMIAAGEADLHRWRLILLETGLPGAMQRSKQRVRQLDRHIARTRPPSRSRMPPSPSPSAKPGIDHDTVGYSARTRHACRARRPATPSDLPSAATILRAIRERLRAEAVACHADKNRRRRNHRPGQRSLRQGRPLDQGREDRRAAGRAAMPTRLIDASGCIVMAGAIDIRSHIGGGNVNTARLLLPGEQRAHTFRARPAMTPLSNAGWSTFETGCLYAKMGFTTVVEPAHVARSGAAYASRTRRHPDH